ncbi:MAG: ComEC/Rec2 family competence protein [Acidobacteria bacterium]|nr:ComEC/Rec2 family competence protein [Acidobacteriota bacterium]
MPVPAALLALPFLAGCAAGIAAAEHLTATFAACAAAASVLATLAALAWMQDGTPGEFCAAVVIGAALAGLSMGITSARDAHRPPLLAWFEGLDEQERRELVVLEAVLREDAAVTDYGALIVANVRGVARAGATDVTPCCRGGIRLSITGAAVQEFVEAWRAGRTIRVPAQLRLPTVYRNPGVPDARWGMALRGVVLVGSVKSPSLVEVVAPGGRIPEAAGDARAWTRRVLRAHVGRRSERSGAVATAILINDRSGLDPDDERRLQEAGTYHVIAISGGNIAILTVMLLAACRAVRMAPAPAAAVSIVALIFYAHLTGAPASVTRAVTAAVVFLAGRMLDQRGPALNALAVAAVCAIAAWPLTALDAGFILSFGATLGILLGTPGIVAALTVGRDTRRDRGPLEQEVRRSGAASFAVPQQGTGPLEQEVRRSGATLLAVPLQGTGPLEQEVRGSGAASLAVPQQGAGSLEPEVRRSGAASFAVPPHGTGPLEQEVRRSGATSLAVPQHGAGSLEQEVRRSGATLLAVPLQGTGPLEPEVRRSGATSLAVPLQGTGPLEQEIRRSGATSFAVPQHRAGPLEQEVRGSGATSFAVPLHGTGSLEQEVRRSGATPFSVTWGGSKGLTLVRGIWTTGAGLLGATICAELALAPVGAALFSRVTLAGLVVNFAAVPLMTLTQLAAMATLAASWFSDSAAGAAGMVADGAAWGLVESARLVDVAPWLAHEVARPRWTLVAAYYAACVWLVLGWRRAVAAGCVGAGYLLLVAAPLPFTRDAAPPRPGLLRAVFLDVGQADATLVTLPDGRALLVDAGGSPGSSFDVGARIVAPALRALGVRRLEELVVTHGDADHAGGALSISRLFRPRVIREGTPVPRDELMKALADYADASGAAWRMVQAGDVDRVAGVEIRVLHPPLPDWERQRVRNDDSIVLEFRYGDVSIVLPGDIGREPELALLPRLDLAPLVVLKAAHHGSASSSTAPFLRAIRPAAVIFSAGRNNRFGHPAPVVVERFRASGTEIFRTDEDGAIVVETDGRTVEVRTFGGRRVSIER